MSTARMMLAASATATLLYHQLSNTDSEFYASGMATKLAFSLFPDAEDAHKATIKLASKGLFPKSPNSHHNNHHNEKNNFTGSSSEESSSHQHYPDLRVRPWFSRKKDQDAKYSGLMNFGEIVFDHPVGLAAGFDKDGEAIPALLNCNFSFVEIGSVTPLPQAGNPKPRVFRLIPDQAIINRYGFNSKGHGYVSGQLYGFRNEKNNEKNENCHGLVGVNLGKNKDTKEASASLDYALGVRRLARFADYIVINVSSPNTKGLRDLQFDTFFLSEMVNAVKKERENLIPSLVRNRTGKFPPILVKIAPDMSESQFEATVSALIELQVDGIILSNTTVSRPETLKSEEKLINEVGGLSGEPLKSLSTRFLPKLYEMCSKSDHPIPIISVGGLSDGRDAYKRLRLGASLLSVYSSFVYKGPGISDKILQELEQCLKSDGFKSVQEIIGIDACKNK